MRAADHCLSRIICEEGEIAPTYQLAKGLISARYQLCRELFLDYSLDLMKKSVQEIDESLPVSTQVYGEVEFASLFHILQECRPQPGQVFADLGHGSGKAIFGAFILYGDIFSKLYGVEIVPTLHGESLNRMQRLANMITGDSMVVPEQSDASSSRKKFAPFWNSVLQERKLAEVIDLEEGDILHESVVEKWTSSDVVLANSTCFGFEMMAALSKQAIRMKSGSLFISFTLPLPDQEAFEILWQRTYGMSWGVATVYLHRRR